TMGMAGPRAVISQAIDEAHLGMALQDRGNIDDRHILYIDGWNDFKGIEQWFELSRHLRLERSDYNVLSALFSSPGFVEHAVGLAYTRGISQEHFQAPPCGICTRSRKPGCGGVDHGLTIVPPK